MFQLASLTDVHWHDVGRGGADDAARRSRHIFGPVVGAFIVVAMNYLAQFGSWVTVIQGAIFVVCVLTFRRGVVGEIIHLAQRVTAGRTEAPPPAATLAQTAPGE